MQINSYNIYDNNKTYYNWREEVLSKKRPILLFFIILCILMLTSVGIVFIIPSTGTDAAIDWTGHSYTRFTPYSNGSGEEVYSPIEDNSRLGFVVLVVGGYSLIGGDYNGFMTTAQGAVCDSNGVTYSGSQHQGTNTNYYDIRYRVEIRSMSNVYLRQVRVSAKNASGFYVLNSNTDYGINSTQTEFLYGETVDRDGTFGTIQGSSAYDINMLYDAVLVYQYYINGNAVRVSNGSVATELAGGLSRETTLNPSDYQQSGYVLDGFWSGPDKTGVKVLDADGYFVNDYAYTPGATLYPGYTAIYIFDVNNALDGVDNGAASEISFSMSVDGVEVGNNLDDFWDGLAADSIIEIYDIKTKNFYSEYTYSLSDPSVEMADSTNERIKIKMPPKEITLIIYFTSVTPENNAFWIDDAVWSGAGQNFNSYNWKGSGSATDPYLIQSEWDLVYLSWSLYTKNENSSSADNDIYFYEDKYFKQTANLDFAQYYWQPIGLQTKRDGSQDPVTFSGHYDGGKCTISGIYTSPGSTSGVNDYQGLFGVVGGENQDNIATISNINLTNSCVQGNYYVGGIVGSTNNAIITDCNNYGIVRGLYHSAGIVGYPQSNSVIQNNCNFGKIDGQNQYIGGIVGSIENNVTLQGCFNWGYVKGEECVGGIVGMVNANYDITIFSCLNSGNVYGKAVVGGIVGKIANGTLSVKLSHCGLENATVTGKSVGMFVGEISASGIVENCYAVVENDISPYQTNQGTFTNCLWFAGDMKYFYGNDFSDFVLSAAGSCPIPKGLSWIGQSWNEDITSNITSNSEWTAWIA